MVEMAAFMVLGVWALVIIGSLLFGHAGERREWQTERKDLLNRIMSQNYREFAEHEVKLGLQPMKVVPLDELRRELQEDQRQPLGMPV